MSDRELIEAAYLLAEEVASDDGCGGKLADPDCRTCKAIATAREAYAALSS